MAKKKKNPHSCAAHRQTTSDLKKTVFGDKGIRDRVIKLEVLIWIVIVLLIGNGSLLGWTIKTVNTLSVLTIKMEIQNEQRSQARASQR